MLVDLFFYKQVDHLLRGIYVDRCSNKLRFCPKWTINHLFKPMDQHSIAINEDIYPTPPDHWLVDNPSIDKKFANRIEEATLPQLRALQTIEAFSNISYGLGHNTLTLKLFPTRKIYVDLALGRFESAENIFEIFSKHPDYWSKSFFKEGHFNELMNVIRPMVHAQDRPAIAAKLHEWEAYSVNHLKLEKYWQPSPFPIEG